MAQSRYSCRWYSGKLPTYPSPKPTWTLTSHLGQNVGSGEGWVSSFLETCNDPMLLLLVTFNSRAGTTTTTGTRVKGWKKGMTWHKGEKNRNHENTQWFLLFDWQGTLRIFPHGHHQPSLAQVRYKRSRFELYKCVILIRGKLSRAFRSHIRKARNDYRVPFSSRTQSVSY